MIKLHNYYITPQDYKTAEKNGISEALVYRRVNTLLWDVEKAINTPVQKQTDRREWAKVAESNGISYNTFLSRLNKKMNWSEEKAATTPVQKRRK